MATRGLSLAFILAVVIVAPAFADECPPRSCGPAQVWHLSEYKDVIGRNVPGLVSNESWFIEQPVYSFGLAVFYAPGLMRATADWYGYSLKGFIDGVALMSPADLGKTVWMRRPGFEWEGPYLVVDCAAQTDMYSVIFYNREVIEVGFQTALEWGMAEQSNDGLGYRSLDAALGYVEVAVVRERPPENTNIKPTDYAAWWLERMTFTDRMQGYPYFYGDHWTIPDVGILALGEQAERLMPVSVEPKRESVEAVELSKPWASFIRDCY